MKNFLAIVCLWIVSSTIPAISQDAYHLELVWGSKGTGEGQFIEPNGIAVDPSGNVFVVDTLNHRIQKFDPQGNFIIQWGSEGVGDGQFKEPWGAAIDPSGNVYITDRLNQRIQKFDINGNFVTKWGFQVTGDSPSYYHPYGVATDATGNVSAVVIAELITYVTPPLRPYVYRFDSEGNFVARWDGSGTEDSRLFQPTWNTIDSLGHVYVTDGGQIKKFDSDGNFIAKWELPLCNSVGGIATDSSNNVYVTAHRAGWITGCGYASPFSKFDPNGMLITEWGAEEWEGDPPLTRVAVDSSGNVYIADSYVGNRILKFSPGLPPITLKSPLPNEHFNACSLYPLPTFSWDVSETFNAYRIEFSPGRDFTSISDELTVLPPATEVTIPPETWQNITMATGSSRGTIYWRVVGTKVDDTTEISAARSLFIGTDPAGDSSISPTGRRSKPTLTWESNCNTRFKVWFGSDSGFSKKTYSLEVENPTGADGTISKTLTLPQWMRIRLLVRNKTGSTIYWYVESWDALGRYAKTNVMSFVLMD